MASHPAPGQMRITRALPGQNTGPVLRGCTMQDGRRPAEYPGGQAADPDKYMEYNTMGVPAVSTKLPFRACYNCTQTDVRAER